MASHGRISVAALLFFCLSLGAFGTASVAAQPVPPVSGASPPPSNGAPGIPPDVLTIPQLPVPPNSSFAIDDTVLVGNDDDWTGQVILNAPFSVIQVTQFYRTEMPKMGWAETAIVRARRTSISFVRDQTGGDHPDQHPEGRQQAHRHRRGRFPDPDQAGARHFFDHGSHGASAEISD